MHEVSAPEGCDAAIETLKAWRARGDDRFDPVRFHLMQQLAMRAETLDGTARRVLREKLALRMGAFEAGVEARREQLGDRDTAATDARPGPLAQLAQDLVRRAPSAPDKAETTPDTRTPTAETLAYFRNTASRLGAQKRLRQSLATLPENAGPLNSHQLMHRSLTLMQEASPEYMSRFVQYADALLWLEQAAGSTPAQPRLTPRAEAARKSARGKSSA